MGKIQALILLITITIIGIINIIYRINDINRRQRVVMEYRSKLIVFFNSFVKGNILYDNLEYLNRNSCEVQSEIGELGIAASVIDKMAGMQYTNYQIIINGVNDICRNIRIGLRDQLIDTIHMMDSSLSKYIGYADSKRKELISFIKNPFILLREGIRVIVGFPIYFLYWTGLIQYSRYSSIKNNIIVKFIVFSIGTLGFIGTVITIVTGYQPFINIIKQFIK